MNEHSIERLRARIAGDFVVPGDSDWDEARRAWNLAVEQRPAAVALPESAEDVVEIVRFARRHGLRVAPQGTGHNAGALAIDGDILLKTERMRMVSVDPAARTARVDAGVLWAEVTEAAAPHGLAGLSGSSPDVGVVGYSLGGGISWLGRRYGLSASSVTAVELVTADGRLIRVDADHEPDLFWALRGGGGSFGVVTALELRLYPVTEVYAGILFFPLERGAEVLNAWREWAETVPDEVTSLGRFLQFPRIPEIPEPLRGKSFVVVEATFLMDWYAASTILEPLRALNPTMDTFATMPITELKHLHMDPDHPVPGYGDGMLLREFDAEAIDAMVTVAGVNSRSPLFSVEIRHLGGALAEARPDGGALAKLDAGFAMFAVGMTPTPESRTAVELHVNAVKAALARWDAGRTYLNFAETRSPGASIWGAETYERLRRVKAKWDANDVLRSNHPVAPADRRRARVATRVRPARVSGPSRIARRLP
ncbi:MAG TPA: FAD-binding protein [Gaiellaceae bacterium]|nr:FAD-binding protein [Gaiellaceae bacterium]